MIDKAAAGVKVGGVFETTGSQTQYSEFGRMKKAGLDVYTDGSPYTMHHKVIVVDERIVMAGSFNFSSSADHENDENLLVIDDPALARSFKAEYDRVLDQAKHPIPKARN
jgi:phosphatidylserine/phosphatidylglycerophosphate/cardiolipin synthase-like enzyme